jgi:hypothetical protein
MEEEGEKAERNKARNVGRKRENIKKGMKKPCKMKQANRTIIRENRNKM